MNIVIVDQPPVTPVSLEEIYAFLRLDPSGTPPEHPDDAMLRDMLASATEKVQAATNRTLVEQTIRLVLPTFESAIELARPPFREMVSVKYIDAAGDEQTVDPDSYYVADQALVPVLRSSTSWPTAATREDAVRVEYVAGYAPADSSDFTANIPASIKSAIKFEVQLQYDELSPEKRAQLETTIARLLGQYRIHTF